MRLTDTAGGIAVGQRSDLVLLDADPLENIRNSARIEAVVLNGRFLSGAALEALLVTAQRMARASDPSVGR
jgi:imidazolonepropionase-like amidohydrolase